MGTQEGTDKEKIETERESPMPLKEGEMKCI